MFTGTSLFVSSCKTRMGECLCFGSMQIKIIYSGKKENREEEYNFQGTCSVSIVYVPLTMRTYFLFCLLVGETKCVICGLGGGGGWEGETWGGGVVTCDHLHCFELTKFTLSFFFFFLFLCLTFSLCRLLIVCCIIILVETRKLHAFENKNNCR